MKTKLYNSLLCSLVLFAFAISNSFAQTITCKQVHKPSADIMLLRLIDGRATHTYDSDPPYEYLQANIGTWSDIPCLQRSFLNFDLSVAQNNPKVSINNIYLNLFNPYTSNFRLGHQRYSTATPNRIVFNRVTQSWDKYEIRWNTQPAIDTETEALSQAFSGNTDGSFESVRINLNDVLLDEGILRSDYAGISFRCYQEDINDRFRFANFASTRYFNPAYWPRLEVEYTLPEPTILFDNLNAFEVIGENELESLFDVQYSWNINGNTYYGKEIEVNNTGTFNVQLTISIQNDFGDICYHTITGIYGSLPIQSIICLQQYNPTAEIMLSYKSNGATSSTYESNPPYEYLQANIGTWSSVPGLQRSFLNFDLSAALNTPEVSVNNVYLNLHNPYTSNSRLGHQRYGTSTPNRIVFNRITQPWDQYETRWHTQPNIDAGTQALSQVFSGTSVGSFESVRINLNDVLLDNGIFKSDYEGISFRCYQENINDRYRFANFASTRHPNSNYWPVLDVEYIMPAPNIVYDGYNTLKVVNDESMRKMFGDIYYHWYINGRSYYGSVINVTLSENNNIVVGISLMSNLSYGCVYDLPVTLNFSRTKSSGNIAKDIIINKADETAKSSAFTVYPNPTTGFISIDIEDEKPLIQIYSIDGKLLKETDEKNIDISSYVKGTYIINVNGENVKIIKN